MSRRIMLWPLVAACFMLAACGTSDDGSDPATTDAAIQPAAVDLHPGDVQQFHATGPEFEVGDVRWRVLEEGGGSVDANGLYTAPDTTGTYTVEAYSLTSTLRMLATAVIQRGRVAVQVDPREARLAPGETLRFHATVTGANDTSVTWSVEPSNGGTITSGGRYTAPTRPGVYTVRATSVANSSRSAVALVTVEAPQPAVSVSVEPRNVQLEFGQTHRFAATVTGAADTAVTWSVDQSTGGSISSTGRYTAPQRAGTYTVRATSVADASRSATATVTVVAPPPAPAPAVSVSVEPRTQQLEFGQTFRFAATVANAADTSVVWSVDQSTGGSISSTGRYTAPQRTGTFTVRATSVADTSRSATATVTVVAPAPPPVTEPPPAPSEPGAVDRTIVPADRRTTWNPGVPGGIPRVTRIHTTIDAARFGNNSTDATQAIQDAINAAGQEAARSGAAQVVYLPAGTYRTSRSIAINRSNVILRGAGKGRTIIHQTTAGNGTIYMGSMSSDFRDTPVVNVVGSPRRGDTQITVADASGFAVGDIIQIDQLEDGDPRGRSGWVHRLGIWWSLRGPYARHQNSGLEAKFPDSPNGYRPIAQRNEVRSKSGNTITLTSPLHIDFPSSQNPQIFRSAGRGRDVIRYSGLEDMTVRGTMRDGAAKDMIHMNGTAYSWIKGVESDGRNGNFIGKHINVGHVNYRCEIRESYVHRSKNLWPGANAYGIMYSGSDCLIEDNVAYLLNKPIVGETTGGGNVIAYNYVDEAVNGSATNGWQETAIDTSHGSFSHNDLFEGNLTANLVTDSTQGNNGWMTFFRNHATGQNTSAHTNGNLRAIEVAGWNREHTSIGNVLLTPTTARNARVWSVPSSQNLGSMVVYRLGTNTWDANGNLAYGNWDNGTAERLFYRHLDFDYVNNSVYDNPANPVRTLPRSLFRSEKPAFFGNLDWPPMNPRGATHAERVKPIPAKARFDAGVP